jgi:hypothetical protein
MKKKLSTIISALALAAVILTAVIYVSGCTTNQQKISYNTLYSIENTTTAAYVYYVDGVISGKYSTNSLPKISHDYNVFQAAVGVALDGVQYNTNALAPINLQTEAGDIINLINQAKGGK